MELSVINSKGKKAGTVKVSESTFGKDFNEALVHQVVTAYQAGARAGTRAQKNRSAVSGGGTKPWRQKGTGRARAGTIRSPIWRGGGKTFPASTKDFSQKVNKKMYRAAMRSIISELVRQDCLLICDDIKVSTPKTQELATQLADLSLDSVLIVNAESDDNLMLSARNLPRVGVCESAKIDPVSLVRFEKVVMSSDAVQKIEEWLQ